VKSKSLVSDPQYITHFGVNSRFSFVSCLISLRNCFMLILSSTMLHIDFEFRRRLVDFSLKIFEFMLQGFR
jgi:hypothetical protein